MSNTVLSPGDFTGDGKVDILARTPAGNLYLYPGNGNGGFATRAKIIGTGWNMFDTLISPGDFTGDAKNDILARTPAGTVYLYPGNGNGGFATAGKVIGTGWNGFNTIISSGDLTGDRKADLIGRKPDGRSCVPLRRQRKRRLHRRGPDLSPHGATPPGCSAPAN